MDELLGEDSSLFWKAILEQPPRLGIRVNTLKTTPHELFSRIPGSYAPLPWTTRGYLREDTRDLGKHPLHVAGLFYLQEPSAMAPAPILDPRPGEWILDLAAAPGGKTTQIASLMDNQGILIANDPHPQRAAGLEQNLERCGVKNAFLTMENPAKMADQLGAVFDRVLVDAPCSGEGMFRSHPSEIKRWSESTINRCVQVQNDILWHAARLVRPGGVLVYSTCTFSPEENEGRIAQLLSGRQDYLLDTIPERPGFSSGEPGWIDGDADTSGTIRIWPHRAPGEGHFIARLRRRAGNLSEPEVTPGFQIRSPDRQTRDAFSLFLNTIHRSGSPPPAPLPSRSHLHQHGHRLYAVPGGAPDFGSLRLRNWGWELGSIKNGSFHPAHALALGLPRETVKSVLEFPLDGQDILRYFRGLTVHSPGKDTWLLATVAGFPVGWARRSSGKVKSFAPRWLRQF